MGNDWKSDSNWQDHSAIVRVAWLDATQEEESMTEDLAIGVIRYSVGYAVRNDEEGIVLAMDLCDGEYTKGYTVPSEYVKDVEVLG